MSEDKQINESISSWLEATAPAGLPGRVLDATFERTRASRQQVGWRGLLMRLRLTRVAPALGGAVSIVMVAALALGLHAGQPGAGGRSAAFVGNWENYGDEDGGHQTMAIVALRDGSYDVTIRDDVASVCDRKPSTMTGVAKGGEPNTFVIEQPEYRCDDGSEAKELSGPPLAEQLRNLEFTYDPVRDKLQDSLGLGWSRVEFDP